MKRYASTAADYERYVSAHADEASKVEAMSLFHSQVGTLLKSATQADTANIEADINELVSRWHGMKFRR